MSKWKIQYLGFAAVLVAAGCAQELPPRSFVQPNVIKKADLDGTWHYIQTVVEAPATNGSAFQGQSSSLMKIRFEVQEDHLYAKRAIEHVEGSEDGYWKDPAHYKGQILASWRISKQFDIIRDYNSTTGEQTNKVIESEERPWNQREFIRVDWSQNEVTDYVGIGLDFFFSDGQPQVQNVSYWVSDPTHPDALHFERAMADDAIEGFQKGEANYLDVTDQVVLTPDLLTATYQENGQWHSFTYPKCFFYYTQDDCASQRVKIRHAFAKIGAKHDVETRVWDGKQMQLFGVWDVGMRRLTYNRQYGIVDSGFRRHAARFNLWKQSCNKGTACRNDGYRDDSGVWHVVDPNDAAQDPRIPYTKRQMRTTPYYAEGSRPTMLDDGTVEYRFPEELYPQFVEIVKQWNDAAKVAVSDLLGGPAPQEVFVACHNPVKDGDPSACKDGLVPETDAKGNQVYRARQGDPRRSNVFWVNEEQNAGPLGYGPPLYDEETGETISGQAYIYGAALDTYAARSRDLMLLQNGEINTADYTTGQNVKDFVATMQKGSPQKPQTFSDKDVSALANAMDFNFAKAFTADNGYPAIDTSSNQNLKLSLGLREDSIYSGFFGQRAIADSRNARLSRLVGRPLEKMMITQENLAVGGVSPLKHWEDLSPIEQVTVSPVRAQLMEAQSIKERLRAERLGVDFATFDDAGLSQRLRLILNDPAYCPAGKDSCQLAKVSEKLRQDLRSALFLAVTLHEVGHNMGCRHNFRASYDAMNYYPDYWKIRTEAITHPDPGMAKNPDGKLHARYLNMPGGAATQYELDNAVREKQYSSIMDYGAEFNSDLLGLGLYDKALMKFSYAETLEVFTDVNPDMKADAAATIGSLHVFQNSYGLPTPLAPGAGLKAIPYTVYPSLFASGWQGIYKRKDVPRAQVMQQNLANNNTIIADQDGNPMVPYFFCSDEFVGNLSCQRFDTGPDPYEQAQDIISRYQNFYLYNNFKRDRQSFHSSLGYKSRVAGRYFNILREQLTWYVLLRSDFEGFTSTNCELNGQKNCDTVNAFFATENNWGGFTLGIAQGFELIGQTLTMPTIGLFGRHTDAAGQTYYKQFNDNLFDGQQLGGNLKRVNYFDGKFIDTKWDFDACGYYWAEECQNRIGYMVDKQVALDVMSQSQAYFTGRDTNTDVRQYAIGYIIPFKKQIEEKFGSIFANDFKSLAPACAANAQNSETCTVKQRSWVLDDPTAFPSTDRIDPSTGFTVQLYAGVYGLSAFPTTFDHDFIDLTQVFVVGNGEAPISDTRLLDPQGPGCTDPSQLISHGGNKEWFMYTDPVNSSKVYAAHSVATSTSTVPDTNGTAVNDYTLKTVALRRDIAVRMLEHLKALGDHYAATLAIDPKTPNRDGLIAAAKNEYDLYQQNIEVMRSLHNAFGYGAYKTDAPFYY